MTSRLTQEMRCKIFVWQEANGSVRQTQRLFNREFGINLASTRRTIYAIHATFFFGVSLRVKFTPHGLKTLKSWNKNLEHHVD